MPDTSNVREVQQARASTSLPTLTGKPGQLVIDKITWRPHVMDGTTQSGHPVAMKSETDDLQSDVTTLDGQVVKTVSQTLDSTKQEQALTNLGVTAALQELITEYGGTVPTDSDTQSVQTLSADDDPWADLT